MKNTKLPILIPALILILSGCSSDYLNTGYSRPNTNSLPKIPELDSRVVTRPKIQNVTVRPSKPAIQKYTISSSTNTVDSPRIVELAKDKDRKIILQGQVSVEADPYASIPESRASIQRKPTTIKSSPAVTALMVQARADLSIGKTQSAISKLERGLRIESQNPNVWHLLAQAQYDQSNHQQAISMAKKSIRYASDDKLIAQNWSLIQESGEKSDDAIAIKEALDYFKVNP